MKDIILDTLLDGIKLIPFLFLAFFIIEVLEHKLTKKNKKIIEKSGKFGPIIGSILGVFPQCGFSVMATNIYATRIISLGTLISIYLATSDEMLPVLISHQVEGSLIIKILLLKVFIGMIFGFIIDLILRKKEKVNYNICDEEHCHCKKNILEATIKHTLKILLFIMIISFVINIIFENLGTEFLSTIFLKNNILGIFVSSLVGLIPNCGASVAICELYLNNAISFGALISGLLTGSGIGLMVLFKTNKNLKENVGILLLLYLIGVISGIVIDIILKIF